MTAGTASLAGLTLTECAVGITPSDLMTVVSESAVVTAGTTSLADFVLTEETDSAVVTAGTTLLAGLALTERAVDITRSDLMTVVADSSVVTAGTTSLAGLKLTERAIGITLPDLMTVVSDSAVVTAGTTSLAGLTLTELDDRDGKKGAALTERDDETGSGRGTTDASQVDKLHIRLPNSLENVGENVGRLTLSLLTGLEATGTVTRDGTGADTFGRGGRIGTGTIGEGTATVDIKSCLPISYGNMA